MGQRSAMAAWRRGRCRRAASPRPDPTRRLRVFRVRVARIRWQGITEQHVTLHHRGEQPVRQAGWRPTNWHFSHHLEIRTRSRPDPASCERSPLSSHARRSTGPGPSRNERGSNRVQSRACAPNDTSDGHARLHKSNTPPPHASGREKKHRLRRCRHQRLSLALLVPLRERGARVASRATKSAGPARHGRMAKSSESNGSINECEDKVPKTHQPNSARAEDNRRPIICWSLPGHDKVHFEREPTRCVTHPHMRKSPQEMQSQSMA